MTKIRPAAASEPAGSGGAVLETTVGGVLRAAAERAAGTIALVEGTADYRQRRRWSYADLLTDSERVARALLGRFAPGDRVAVWAPNSPEWLLMEFGAALAGLTLVTVNPALRAAEVGHVLGQSRAQGVLLAPAYRGADPATGQSGLAGAVGEILTRGYHVMKGYFDNPAATREAIDAAGWLHTGDLGSADQRGYYRIEGRLKEMIIRGGENIYPGEIEQVLYAHPAVADVAVVGVPDDHWGEQVAAHKTPRHWVFVNTFPLTASGKVQKFVLREEFASGRIQASG
jgi:acyl-CoA synthetase (AMP-forming)/AMP-acid ligase II